MLIAITESIRITSTFQWNDPKKEAKNLFS